MALFEFHIHNQADLDKVLAEILKEIKHIQKTLTLMATREEFQAALAEVTTALDNISADITRLTDQLANGGLTQAEQEEVYDQLRAVAERAKSIAAVTPEEVVEPTPTPEGETPA